MNPTQRTDGKQADVLSEAIDLHRRGLCIIPIKYGTKDEPVCQWKCYQTKRPTMKQLREWFGAGRRNLAVVCGAVSGGLVIRDFDKPGVYEAWADSHPDLAKTLPTVKTGKGWHVYFVVPDGELGGIKHFDDGEYRAGGYCLLPPSRHPNGSTYEWLIPLPDGPLPIIDNPHEVGLIPVSSSLYREDRGAREDGDNRDNGGQQKITEAIKGSTSLLDEPVLTRLINETLPQEVGNRNRQVFELARAIKAIPALADATANDLEPIVQAWHEEGVRRSVIDTVPFEETLIDFYRGWPKVRYPKGTGPMTEMLEAARRAALPECAGRYEQEPFRLLVGLCRELQRHAGDGVFFLSCRTAGGLLGVSHTQANGWLFLLRQHKVLELVEPGQRGGGKAARYRYTGD